MRQARHQTLLSMLVPLSQTRSVVSLRANLMNWKQRQQMNRQLQRQNSLESLASQPDLLPERLKEVAQLSPETEILLAIPETKQHILIPLSALTPWMMRFLTHENSVSQ